MKRMTLKFVAVMVLISTILACETELNEELEPISTSVNEDQISSGEGMTVLGDKIEIAESMDIIRQALKNLDEAGIEEAAEMKLEPTHFYVRFLPANEVQLEQLWDIEDSHENISIFEYPLDREIIYQGQYYHDPDIDISEPTWHYTRVPVDFEFSDIRYEILDKLFFIDDYATMANGPVNMEFLQQLEEEAYKLVGYDISEESTNGRKAITTISGRLTVDGRPVPGVKIFLHKGGNAVNEDTDSDGRFTFETSMRAKNIYFTIRFSKAKKEAGMKWKMRECWTRTFGTKGETSNHFRRIEYTLGKKDRSYWVENGLFVNFEKKDGNYTNNGVQADHYKKMYYASYATIALDHFFFNQEDGLKKKITLAPVVAVHRDNIAGYDDVGILKPLFIDQSFENEEIIGQVLYMLAQHYVIKKLDQDNDLLINSFALAVSRKYMKEINGAVGDGSINVCPSGYEDDHNNLIAVDLMDPVHGPLNNQACGSKVDQVSGYSILQLEKALDGANRWDHWRDRIKEFHDNPTEDHVDALFEFWGDRAGL